MRNNQCKGKCKCKATWYYIIDIGRDPTTGRRKQKKEGGFKTKKEAEEASAKVLLEVESGTYYDEKDITFEEFAYEWLTLYESSGRVKESTIRIRKHEIKRLLDYFAKLKLRDITAKRYQNALNGLYKREFATNTIEGAHITGQMIFKKAIELEVIKKNPTEFAIVPKPVKTVEELEQEDELPEFMEKKELQTFLETAKEKGLDQDYPIFMLLSYTGIRAGELCSLKWSDIDFEEQTVSITKTYYNPYNNIRNYKHLTPKTLASKRIIDIDDDIIKTLKDHKVFQNKIILSNGSNYYNKNYVFINIKRYPGYPLYIKRIENRMARLLKLAKLNDNLKPHSLRHTHTSLLAQLNLDLKLIMDRLGHEDERTTRKVYTHVTQDRKKEASIKFAELMKDL